MTVSISYTCRTCNAHWDHHDRDDLCCPAYTALDGSVVFSEYHHYAGQHPERYIRRNVGGQE